jgi:hypothetical protein
VGGAGHGGGRVDASALAHAYAVHADGGEAAGAAFADLFTPDGTLTTHPADGSTGTHRQGRAALAQVPGVLAARYDRTLHLVSTQDLALDDDAGTGTGTTYCEAHHRAGDVDTVLAIRYDDRLARHGGSWRFAARAVHVLWVERRPIEAAGR